MTQIIADQIAQEFTDFLNDYHSQPEVFDDELDAQIHRWYADYLTDRKRKTFPPRGLPYFSPSSADDDPRALYEKIRGAKREQSKSQPNQGRQVRIGTAIGDVIQRDILFAEKHYADKRFSFTRNEYGEPVFEDFAKVSRILEHKGKKFALYGTADGIMRYVSEDGESIRVGLEVKSKQSTYAKTSPYSMRNGAEDKHVKQCVCYSMMYDVDYYIVLYVNGARKGWFMSDEDFEKNPDIMAFGLYITDDMREEILDHFADIVRMADEGDAPNTDLERWTFNSFKQRIAKSLTDEEVDELRRREIRMNRSRLPDWQKAKITQAFEELKTLREAAVE